MYSYFSDLHVQLLSQALLQPGEKLAGQVVTEQNSWWTLGFFRKTFLALATDQRLILVEHRMAWLHASLKLHSVESIPWSCVEETRIKGIFTKKIRLRAQTQQGAKRIDMTVPNRLFGLLAPMRQNMQGARNVVGAFQASRQLGAGPTVGSLPPASVAFNAPQLSPAPFGGQSDMALQGQAQGPSAEFPPAGFAPGFAHNAPTAQSPIFVPPPAAQSFAPGPFPPFAAATTPFVPPPVPQSFAAPPSQSFAPPPHSFAPPPSGPAINAQGYASVPPPPPSGGGTPPRPLQPSAYPGATPGIPPLPRAKSYSQS